MLTKQLYNYIFYLIQLLFLGLVLITFNLEYSSEISKILPIIGIGFSIHYWLGKSIKIPFFTLISFLAILLVLGLINGLIVIGCGLFLISLCHIPIKYNYRLIIISLVILLFLFIRIKIIPLHSFSILLPYVGTIFMIRLFLYLYEIKFDDSFNDGWSRVAYFFLIPNICFPLFPLVDYKIFKTTYYNIETSEIIKKALKRIYRGVFHLIGYKIIYLFISIDPTEITDLVSFANFLIFTYALIIRMSGIFHLSIGILGLFGFNLPKVFDNYFYSSNFNNLWQRINIYWKDALMKLVYYPVYFKLKSKFNPIKTIALTILIVFVFNWFLHAYQWFWIKGGLPYLPIDITFWGFFGVAVMWNSIIQHKNAKSKKLGLNQTKTLKTHLIEIIKPLGMYLFMCFLWMLWTGSSFSEWIYLLSYLNTGDISQWLTILIYLIFVIILILIIKLLVTKGYFIKLNAFYKTHILTISLVSVIAVLCIPVFNKISYSNNYYTNTITSKQLNNRDKRNMERGYYQSLLNNDNNQENLWQNKSAKNWNSKNTGYQKTKNILRKKFKPNQKIIFKGKKLSTNKWGMRDKNYSLSPSINTHRIVLLGGSYEMGSGVANNKNYESFTEEMLNDSLEEDYEILNLAAGGYNLIENEFICRNIALKYNPKTIIYSAHSNERERVIDKLTLLVTLNYKIENSFLLKVIDVANVKPNMPRIQIYNQLKPFGNLILKWGYLSIAKTCSKNNIKPIWMYFPAIGDEEKKPPKNMLKFVEKLKFSTLIIKDPYKNQKLEDLIIAPWDYHPNEKGHQLIANKLFDELMKHKKELKLK